ncbi:hypothetical protein ACJJWD_00095 [Comamonas testosteroni]|uniref:hypothetical protein n=1 Tax=Comamonas testosteroni TaxID=285 RepID=UPI00389B176B
MNWCSLTTVALSLVAAFSIPIWGHAAQPAKHSTTQQQKSSSGCGGSPNVIDNSGHIQINVTCHMINAWSTKNRMNSLEINQERLLLAKNPTELRITGTTFQRWLSDNGRISLTLEFENPRDIPIPEIEIDFLDPNSGASIPELKPLALTRSQVYREIGTNKFSLAAGTKTSLPVAFLDEIVEKQLINSGFCVFDTALKSESGSGEALFDNPGHSSTVGRTVLMRARLKSIFGQELVSTQFLWIFYGKGSDGKKFWYPGKQHWDALTCVN